MDEEALRDKWNEIKEETNSSNGPDANWWKPSEGKNAFLVLPPWDGADFFFKEVGTHFGVPDFVGGDEQNRLSIPCRRFHDEVCPLCNLVDELDEGDEDDQNLAQRIYATEKYAMNVIPILEGGKELSHPAPGVYSATANILDSILDVHYSDRFPKVVDVDNWTGLPFQIKREGQGKQTRYKNVRPYGAQTESYAEYEIDSDENLVNLNDYFSDPGYESVEEAIEWKKEQLEGNDNDSSDNSASDDSQGTQNVSETTTSSTENSNDSSDSPSNGSDEGENPFGSIEEIADQHHATLRAQVKNGEHDEILDELLEEGVTESVQDQIESRMSDLDAGNGSSSSDYLPSSEDEPSNSEDQDGDSEDLSDEDDVQETVEKLRNMDV